MEVGGPLVGIKIAGDSASNVKAWHCCWSMVKPGTLMCEAKGETGNRVGRGILI